MSWETYLHQALDTSFFLVFAAFAGGALYLLLERDRVPEDFRTALRVSVVYLAIAALNYFYMMEEYSAGDEGFPTAIRYVDWFLTTPLMLLKFPLLLGLGPGGRKFMVRLVVLDLVMIGSGLIGEVTPTLPALHYGSFLVGCVAWLVIVLLMVMSLGELPERLDGSTRRAVRVMSMFFVIGWAVYPLGYLAPLLGVPFEVRELVYNLGDLGNKLGLCLVVYVGAKQTASERGEAEPEPAADGAAWPSEPPRGPMAGSEPGGGAWLPEPAQ